MSEKRAPKTAQKQQPTFFKAQTIKVLRATIQSLEGVVEKLETLPPPTATDTVSQTPPIAPKSEIPETVMPPQISTDTPIETVEDTEGDVWKEEDKYSVPAAVKEEKSDRKTAQKTAQKQETAKPSAWQRVLGLVRSLLPATMSQKLSDGILTVAIATIFLVLLTVPIFLLTGKPATEIAEIPAIEEPQILVEVPPEELPPPEEVAEELPLGEIAEEFPPEEVAEEESPMPDLVAPEAPQLVEVRTPPPPKLTPEQYLVVAIKNQIADVTNMYGGGIIESIKPNFPSSLLMVEVSNDWYYLDSEEQDKLANGMLQQARDLDFSKLQIINSEGRAIARSPVIGSGMIILERSLLEM